MNIYMRTIYSISLLFFVCFESFANALPENETLCIPESPPYSSSELPYHGPLTELIVNSLKLSNINVTLLSPPWARIMREGEKGNCIIAGLWPTEERRKVFYFSTKPVIKQALGIYIEKDKELADIRNGVLALQRSTYLSKNISTQQWKYYNVKSTVQGAQMLALSRVDALFAEIGRMQYLLSEDKELAQKIKLTSPIIEYVYGYVAVSKQHKNAKKIIEAIDNNVELALNQLQSAEAHYLNLNNAPNAVTGNSSK